MDAVPEETGVKKRLTKCTKGLVSRHTLLATNASTTHTYLGRWESYHARTAWQAVVQQFK